MYIQKYSPLKPAGMRSQTWHDRVLAGRFVLQVDEMCNASVAANQRYFYTCQSVLKQSLIYSHIKQGCSLQV